MTNEDGSRLRVFQEIEHSISDLEDPLDVEAGVQRLKAWIAGVRGSEDRTAGLSEVVSEADIHDNEQSFDVISPEGSSPSVEERSARGLQSRLEQRPLVDQLVASWAELSRGFTDLVAAVEAVGRPAGPAPSVDTEARTAVTSVLTATGDAPTPSQRLADRIQNVERLIDAVRARTNRNTVNIGVIGSTKAGKSTLLRTITGLPDTVIPTTQFNPTTASTSRIYHAVDRSAAVLTLHTWESFRDTYLAPLHQNAHLQPPPRQPGNFRSYRYPVPGSTTTASADDFLRKLHEAQSSFDSYEYLLTGPHRTLEIGFEALRPFVAYPDKQGSDPMNVRPYHAVRDVYIKQRFPHTAVSNLGLIDLPGAGETGLDVDTQFVQRVRSEIDFLLMVKRGGPMSSAYLVEDSYALRLADSARGGASLEDFLAVVVNRDKSHDPTGEYFANTLADMRAAARERRITVFGADVIQGDDVAANVLRPVFDHLAATLARMDRANMESVLTEAGQTAADVASFAAALAAEAERQLSILPNQAFELRRLARDLLFNVGKSLFALRDQYDDLVRFGDAAKPQTRAIDTAVRAASDWVDTGLGTGSADAWFAQIEGAWVVGSQVAAQDEYHRVKAQITKYFADVDNSREESINALWNRVADVLRSYLTEELVPIASSGEEALKHLRDHAAKQGASIIREALDQLLSLRVGYGSIVLRVTRPIIRAMDPEDSARRDALRSVESAVVDAVIDGAAAATGSPIPVAAIARKTYAWVAQPDGSRRRVPVAPPSPSAPLPSASPRPALANVMRSGVQELYEELTTRARDTIDQLQKKLTDEAQTMAAALAAATDVFFESMIRTNDVAWEYELLSGPYRREIWPEKFDGGTPQLAADLSALQKQAQVVIVAVSMLNEQRVTTLPRRPRSRRAGW